jgi:hypothetical protein
MGFGVLMFDMGGDGSMYWISNAERPGMVRAMREWIAKNETADRAHRGRICPQCHGVGTLQR